MTEEPLCGAIVVDKPQNWTSHDVVNRMRRVCGTRRIGHLGTLDPIATGVLPLVVGRATRLAQFFSANEKVYEAVVRFGHATSTYDREGAAVGEIAEDYALDGIRLESELASFVGQTEQMPPAVSAKKIQGKPAYELARQNKPVELSPVRVHMHELRITNVRGADATLYVRCSAGTYMRSLAHDLGQRLGVGAHVQELRRLRSGEFAIEQARTLEQLAELSEAGRLLEALVPAASLLTELDSETVDDDTAMRIRQGRDFRTSPFREAPATQRVKAVQPDGTLVAIGEAVLPNLYHPVCVL